MSDNQTPDAEMTDQTKPAQEEPRKPLGIANQGATCYMNTLLQALFMTKEFRLAIYEWKYSADTNPRKEKSILYQLQKFFASLQISKAPFVTTADLINSFNWSTQEMAQQQDVQEFMRVLFEAVERSFEMSGVFGVMSDSTSSASKAKSCSSRIGYPTAFAPVNRTASR